MKQYGKRKSNDDRVSRSVTPETKVKKCVKMYFLELTDDAVMASLEYGSANRHQMADRSSVTEALLQNFCCRMLQL